MTLSENAAKYLSRIEPSVQGSGGWIQASKAALALIKGFSLTETEALRLLLDWNTLCVPPWPEQDLPKFLQAAAKSSKPDGYLLVGRKDSITGVDPAVIARHKRQTWPAFHRATESDLAVIAGLRGLAELSTYCLRNRGFLSKCIWRDLPCFVIHHGPFAQVRRMDGAPFTPRDGRSIKAMNLPGSQGSFINPGGLGPATTPIILTEGVISVLESIEALARADDSTGRLHAVGVLTATGAASRFTDEWLAKLTGRHVLIFCDNDKAGLDAAANWAASLRSVGCVVKTVLPPQGCNDLGDTLKTMSAGDSYWSKLLTF